MKAVGAGRPVAGDLLETDRVGVGELGQEQHQTSQEGGQHQQSAEEEGEEDWGRKRMKKDHLKGKGWKWEETDISYGMESRDKFPRKKTNKECTKGRDIYGSEE